jgi:hypothetical protein
MEQLIVAVLVAGAVMYTVVRISRTARSASCGGCGKKTCVHERNGEHHEKE